MQVAEDIPNLRLAFVSSRQEPLVQDLSSAQAQGTNETKDNSGQAAGNHEGMLSTASGTGRRAREENPLPPPDSVDVARQQRALPAVAAMRVLESGP